MCTLVVVEIGAFAPVVTAIASQHWANQSVQTSHIRRESIVFANWLVFLVSKHTASHAPAAAITLSALTWACWLALFWVLILGLILHN